MGYIDVTIGTIGSTATIEGRSSAFLDPLFSLNCTTNSSLDDTALYYYGDGVGSTKWFSRTTSDYITAPDISGKIFDGWYSLPPDKTSDLDNYYGSNYTVKVSGSNTITAVEIDANNSIAKRPTEASYSDYICSIAAKFRLPYTYTVSYLPGADGTGEQQTQTKTEGSPLTLYGAGYFTRTGYTQTGWATSDGGAKAYDLAGTYSADAAITLYPVWTPNTYTVTLSDEHHESQTIEVTYGSAYGALPFPVFAGYGFMGWYTAASGGTHVTAATVVSTASDHTLYARWEAETYTIVYYANGGSGTMANSVFSYDETSALVPSCDFVKVGNTCVGWSLTAGGPVKYTSGVTHLRDIVDDLGGPSGPISLYAVWEPAGYTVSFDSDSYLGDPIPSITVRYGGTYGELPSVLYDDDANYIFDGWFYGSIEIKKGDRVRIAEDIELVAHFHQKRVTLVLDATTGGRWFPDSEGTRSVEFEYHGYIPSIAIPGMTDYDFLGYRDEEGLVVYDDDGTFTEYFDWDDYEDGSTATMTAEWVRKRFTITFNSSGGTSVTSKVLGFHELVGDVEPPTKTGHTFTGWSPRIPRFMPKEDSTCTAQWSANTYSVAYALVGGEFGSNAGEPDSGTFDAVIAVPAPTRSGCTFAGWKVTTGLDATTAKYGTSSDSVSSSIASEDTVCANGASGTVYFKNLSAEAGALVVLTAQWTRNDHTITFNPGGSGGYISYDPVAPVSSEKTKESGVPYLLSGNDMVPSYSTTSDDVVQVGWSASNHTSFLSPKDAPCEYPSGTEYVDDVSRTLYPVLRQDPCPDENSVIPVIISCGGKTAHTMARAGATYTLTPDIGNWCSSVLGRVITAWKFNDGTNETTIQVGQTLSFYIDAEASSLTVTPVLGVESNEGDSVVYEYGTLHSGGDIDDVGNSFSSIVKSGYETAIVQGSATIIGARFTRDGFVQVGWTDFYKLGGVTVEDVEDSSFTWNYYDFGDTYSGTDTIVLYPVWERRQYDLTIDLNGGAFPDGAEALCRYGLDKPLSVDEGIAEIENIDFGNVVWIPRPSRDGYKFVGWVFKDVGDPSDVRRNSVSYLARFTVPDDDFANITECLMTTDTGEVIESSLMPVPEIGSSYVGYLKDGTTLYRQGEWVAIKSVINAGREPDGAVTMKAVWRKNTKYRVRFKKFNSETGNVTFTTKEHELGEEWTLPNVGGETAEKSGTEGDQDVTTELGWSSQGHRFLYWVTDFGEFTDGEKIVLGGDVEVGEDEVIDFIAAWEPIQSHVTFRADDWQTETLEASGNVADGLIGVAPASASRTISDSPGKVDHSFILEPTETFTPQRTFGAKVFALVTDYVSQMSVILRDGLLWTEKVTKGMEYLLSYASLISVTAGYAYGNDRTMGAVKVNGKGVAIGGTTVTDGVIYADEATFKAEPLGGYRFVGWYTDASDTSDANLYSRAAETVVFIDDDDGISLYAKFAPEPNGIYEWEGSETNKLMEWKSKVYVGSKPFNPSALRVDATGYPPVDVTVEMFSSPDTDAKATATAKLTNIVSQDSRRLPRMRPERYMRIGVKHDAEVDAIFIGTSMGGLAV